MGMRGREGVRVGRVRGADDCWEKMADARG